MSFLSSAILEKRIPEENIVVNYNQDRLKYAAYELSMGNEAFVTSAEKKRSYTKGEQIVINPGQFAVLITEEILQIPNDLLAFISIKFSIKFDGLINVSGFHVDPGFKGRLKFAVYNAGSKNVVITSGEPLFQIWFSTLLGENSVPYNGRHKDQMYITAEDVMKNQGKIASPNALLKRIENLEGKLNILRSIGIGIIIALLVLPFRSCEAVTQKTNTNQIENKGQLPSNNSEFEQIDSTSATSFNQDFLDYEK
ncbi:MAG: hypothetical protein WEA58_08590 [Balneolaceae bacterium]